MHLRQRDLRTRGAGENATPDVAARLCSADVGPSCVLSGNPSGSSPSTSSVVCSVRRFRDSPLQVALSLEKLISFVLFFFVFFREVIDSNDWQRFTIHSKVTRFSIA